MRILGLSGSLRRGSHNRRLLRAASALLPPGVELVEWDGIAGIPAFDEDLETTPPEPVLEFFRAIEEADALLIATPEYNASLPGALKNALDWASRPFPNNVLRHKPAAVVGASTGLFGAVWAQAEVRKVLKASGAHPVESGPPAIAPGQHLTLVIRAPIPLRVGDQLTLTLPIGSDGNVRTYHFRARLVRG